MIAARASVASDADAASTLLLRDADSAPPVAVLPSSASAREPRVERPCAAAKSRAMAPAGLRGCRDRPEASEREDDRAGAGRWARWASGAWAWVGA